MQVGKRMPKWYADAFKLPPVERAKLRNRTFQGIADAMAEQWGGGGITLNGNRGNAKN